MHKLNGIVLASAVSTLSDHAVILDTSICETFKVVFRRRWPTLFQVVTARFWAEEKLHDIGAVQFPLKIDEGKILESFLLLLL